MERPPPARPALELPVSRVAIQTEARAGVVALVGAYRDASGLKLGQVYRARPTQIKPPSVFVDSVQERTDDFTPNESQRTVRVGVRCVWGVYDAGSTVDQRDRFVDGFYGYFMDHGNDAFGPNTTASWLGTSDDEDWTPGWIESAQPMFSTLITLEGFAST
jgi:hypothetical protein